MYSIERVVFDEKYVCTFAGVNIKEFILITLRFSERHIFSVGNQYKDCLKIRRVVVFG